MSVDALLSRLESVRRVGSDRWFARCPNHPDRHPSLSIREADDGKVLIHCFGQGCGATEVLDAVGLDYRELFPPKSIEQGKSIHRPVFSSDVFSLIRFECSIINLIGCDMHKTKSISEEDYQRLGVAISRLERIAEAAYGS
jgi:hypothetical protein